MAKVIFSSNIDCCKECMQKMKLNTDKKYTLLLNVEFNSKEDILSTLKAAEVAVKGLNEEQE